MQFIPNYLFTPSLKSSDFPPITYQFLSCNKLPQNPTAYYCKHLLLLMRLQVSCAVLLIWTGLCCSHSAFSYICGWGAICLRASWSRMASLTCLMTGRLLAEVMRVTEPRVSHHPIGRHVFAFMVTGEGRETHKLLRLGFKAC